MSAFYFLFSSSSLSFSVFFYFNLLTWDVNLSILSPCFALTFPIVDSSSPNSSSKFCLMFLLSSRRVYSSAISASTPAILLFLSFFYSRVSLVSSRTNSSISARAVVAFSDSASSSFLVTSTLIPSNLSLFLRSSMALVSVSSNCCISSFCLECSSVSFKKLF